MVKVHTIAFTSAAENKVDILSHKTGGFTFIQHEDDFLANGLNAAFSLIISTQTGMKASFFLIMFNVLGHCPAKSSYVVYVAGDITGQTVVLYSEVFKWQDSRRNYNISSSVDIDRSLGANTIFTVECKVNCSGVLVTITDPQFRTYQENSPNVTSSWLFIRFTFEDAQVV